MNKINTINGVLMASQDELNKHVENGTAHVTEEERATWNNKAGASALSSKVNTATFNIHASDSIKHLTSAEHTQWDHIAQQFTFTHDDGGEAGHPSDSQSLRIESTMWGNSPFVALAQSGDITSYGLHDLSHTTYDGVRTSVAIPALIGHQTDSNAHISPVERENWNAKADAATFKSHTANNTVHVAAEERAAWNSKQDKLTDEEGNLTLAGGMTVSRTINAHGGIDIPLAIPPVTDTTAINRLYALGLAQVAMEHHVRNYWVTGQCTATNGVSIDHVVPGCYLHADVRANTRTSLTLPVIGCNGTGNYGSVCGVSLPLIIMDYYNGWDKTTVIIGTGGTWIEHIDADVDGYRMAPQRGSLPYMARAIEVTRWATRTSNGYRMRVREIVGLGNPASYTVRTTESLMPYDSNTRPPHAMCRLVIAQRGHTWGSQQINAGVWMIMGGLDKDSVIKLADLSGWDTINIKGINPIRLDVGAVNGGVWLEAESPTMLRGINGNCCMPDALQALEKSWITGVTEELFSDPDQQPTI